VTVGETTLLEKEMNDMKDIINRLCDLERRTAKIETQAIEQAAQWDTTDMAHRSGGLSVEQEPVAYLCENAVGHKYFRWKKPTSHYKPIALYTAPPKRDNELDIADRAYFAGKQEGIAEREWVGLTDEEIKKIVDINTSDEGGYDIFCDGHSIANAVIDKLKERNNG
jgi:hypothetical protein